MNRRIAVLPAFLVVVLTVSSFGARAEENWPQFRGPTGQGLSDAKNIPVEWDETKNVAWKVPVPGKGWSSPVLAGGRVYLTTAVDEGGATVLRVMCLGAADGKVVWDTEVFRPDPAAVKAMHSKNSPASATPVVAGDQLYAHFGHLGTAALDLSGKVVWRQESLKFQPIHGNGGSPALVGDTLVFSADGGSDPFLAAVDARTGEVKWKTPRNVPTERAFSFSTPLAIEVGGVTQVVSPASGITAAYDPASGRELWRVRTGTGYSVIPRPVFAHGLLFVSSGYDAAVLYAIKADAKASGDVTDTHVAWQTGKGAPNTPSALVVGDEVYFVADNGIATCADARTGRVHWSERLEGDFSASPVAADGRVYFQNEDGVGFVVRASTAFELLAENDLGERSLASYAVGSDGALFIRTDKHLWKIAAK